MFLGGYPSPQAPWLRNPVYRGSSGSVFALATPGLIDSYTVPAGRSAVITCAHVSTQLNVPTGGGGTAATTMRCTYPGGLGTQVRFARAVVIDNAAAVPQGFTLGWGPILPAGTLIEVIGAIGPPATNYQFTWGFHLIEYDP